MRQMHYYIENDGTEVPTSTTSDDTSSSQTIAKPNVIGCREFLVQMANSEKKQIKRWGNNNLMSSEHQQNFKAIRLVIQLMDEYSAL